ncbi:MAG TPA: tetratricopeptide repeat protein [Kofleriaceae bacterium]|nr:tetratricopeptide repeat protein [Kofleriaceae bacterium]
MTRPPLLATALAIAISGASGAAHAQPAPRTPEQQEADRHFKDGVTRYKEGKFDAALAEFKEAYRIAPHPLVLYNMAGCYRELSRYGEAVKAYRQFLAEGPGKAPESRLADARTELDKIYAIVGRVTVAVEPEAGASLLLDGQPLGTLPLEMPLIVSPGAHKLLARAPGRLDVERELRITGGEDLPIAMILPARPEPKGPAGPGTGPGPETGIGTQGPQPPGARGPRLFAVNASFGTNALRAGETGAPSVGVGFALGSRIELGLDAIIVAYAVMPSVRVRLVGDQLAVHAIAAAPISFKDGDQMETFVAGAVGLGLRYRLSPTSSLAVRLESYASFAGKDHGTTIPTFLGGELWF